MFAPPDTLGWLYLDLNSYFASVEQQLHPELRGRPVAVVPAMTDATCAIAASYEAKAYGVKTGTMIYEARRMCPGLVCVQARHDAYVEYHHRVLEEIDRHIPIDTICSIDEVACELKGPQCDPEEAVALARRIKEGLRQHVGEYVRCSIGISTNRFLAKVAGNLQKPDGLTVLHPQELPGRLQHLTLRDLPGIGRNMERRLLMAGIGSIDALWKMSPKHMRKIWHSVGGERFWYKLHGIELPEAPTKRSTVGHSHVLEPEWRPAPKARQVAQRLLLKAASRMRRLGYHATHMSLSLRIENGPRVYTDGRFYRSSDNTALLQHLYEYWDTLMAEISPPSSGGRENAHAYPVRIKKIAVTLDGLVTDRNIQPELFDQEDSTAQNIKRREDLSQAMDVLNSRYGRDTVVMGGLPQQVRSFSGTKIAFTRIPERQEFHE